MGGLNGDNIIKGILCANSNLYRCLEPRLSNRTTFSHFSLKLERVFA